MKSKQSVDFYKKPTVKQVISRWKLPPVEKILALLIRLKTDPQGYRKCHKKQLATEAMVKPETVDRALKKMNDLGILEIKPGKGKKGKASYRLHHSHRVYEDRSKKKQQLFPDDEAMDTKEQSMKTGIKTNKPIIAAVALNKLPHPSQPAKPEN